MAKQTERAAIVPQEAQADAPASFALAERLFVQHWNPKGGYDAEHVVRLCLDAAETFERVKRERAGLRVTEAA
jgi:hypothetical protein